VTAVWRPVLDSAVSARLGRANCQNLLLDWDVLAPAFGARFDQNGFVPAKKVVFVAKRVYPDKNQPYI